MKPSCSLNLVLTDVIMPGGMDGLELAAELEARRPGIKIVFRTGSTLSYTPEAFGSHQTLLYKPIGPQELPGAIRSRLDEAQ
jgi:CheY-like chemotaxis protein